MKHNLLERHMLDTRHTTLTNVVPGAPRHRDIDYTYSTAHEVSQLDESPYQPQRYYEFMRC